MSDYKSILKSNILSVEDKIKKRNVKIKCHNSNAGKLVIQTIQNNTSLFGGYKMKEIEKGLSANDFTVKFEIRDGASTFYKNLTAILNDKTVVATESEKSKFDEIKEGIGKKVDSALNVLAGATAGSQTAGVQATGAPTAGVQATQASGTETGDDEGPNMKTILIAGGALLLVLVIALVIWKKK